MISGVGASLPTRMAREPVEDLALNGSTIYAKPTVSGVGGFKIMSQAAGRVAFDLNDGYSLSIDESKSAFTVANAAGKETVQVWGAAKLALDGTTLGGFAGTTSLMLGNGTKITMETLPETKSADVFHLDRLTVTQGEKAVIVSGVSQVTSGDLIITQSNSGDTVDDQTRDGLVFQQVAPVVQKVVPPPAPAPQQAQVLPPAPPPSVALPTPSSVPPPSSPLPMPPQPVAESPSAALQPVVQLSSPPSTAPPLSVAFPPPEPPQPVAPPPSAPPPTTTTTTTTTISQPTGTPPPETNTLAGWADEYGVAVTPEMLALTLPGGTFGPGSEMMSVEEFRTLMMRFLSWAQVSSFMSWSTQSLNSDLRRQDPSDIARAADIRRAWARHADERAAATRSSLRSEEMRAMQFSR
jgi:hypothetical protein